MKQTVPAELSQNSDGMPVRRILAFISLSGVAALTPLIVIPALTSEFGARGFASLALGQALGTFAATFAMFGWGVAGPSRVAAAEPCDHDRIYTLSLQTRALVFVVVAPLACVVSAWLSSPGFRWSASLACLGFAVWAFAPTWFLVGRGLPGAVGRYETFPRFIAAVAAMVLVLWTGSAWAFGAAFLAAGCLVGAVATRQFAMWSKRSKWSESRVYLRENLPLAASSLVSSSYTSLALPLVSIADRPAAATYAGIDRFRSLCWMGTFAVANAFRAWAISADPAVSRRRARVALLTTTLAGSALAAVVAILVATADGLIFSGEIEVGVAAAVLLFLTMAIVSLEISLTFHYLAPRRLNSQIFSATILGACVGLPSIFILASSFGADGALAGALAAELIACGLLLRHAWIAVRKTDDGLHARARSST